MNVVCTLKAVGGAAAATAIAAAAAVAVAITIAVGHKNGNKMRLNAAATANTCMPSLTMPHHATPRYAATLNSTPCEAHVTQAGMC